MAKGCTAGAEAAQRLITARVRALEELAPGVGSGKPDSIHDMRVASRRLRAIAAEHAPCFSPKTLKPFRGRVRSVTKALGKARELDVALACAEAFGKRCRGGTRTALDRTLELLRALRKAEDVVVARGAALAVSRDFARARSALLAGISAADSCYVEAAVERLQGRHRTVARRYATWRSTSRDEDLHRVRIAFKKLRYACEIYEPLYGTALGPLLGDLKAAQSALGDWNDYRVLRDYVAAMPAPDAEAEVRGRTRLLSLLAKRVTGLREKFAETAHEFFAKERKKRIMALFRKPSVACCRGTRVRRVRT